jgi:hypothetical protein
VYFSRISISLLIFASMLLTLSSRSWIDFLTSYSYLNPLWGYWSLLKVHFLILWHFSHFGIFGFSYQGVRSFWRSHIALLLQISYVSRLRFVNMLGWIAAILFG